MSCLRILRRAGAAVLLLVAATGCGSTADEPADLAGATNTESSTAEAAPAATTSTTDTPTVPVPVVVPETADATSDGGVSVPDADCRRIEDFDAAAADRWTIVDDGVMGGRSKGDTAVVDGVLVFSGVIETEGGGFSSVRSALPTDAVAGATELRFRVRSDGRAYELIADDAVERDRRVSHFGAIPVVDADVWEEVSVPLDGLEARVFGTPVDDAAFEPGLATSIGVILADGVDGPFELEIDHIEACG